MDVVEIDPGVTQVAYEYLGLKDYRRAQHRSTWTAGSSSPRTGGPGTYDLVIQDAVNDLSGPGAPADQGVQRRGEADASTRTGRTS